MLDNLLERSRQAFFVCRIVHMLIYHLDWALYSLRGSKAVPDAENTRCDLHEF